MKENWTGRAEERGSIHVTDWAEVATREARPAATRIEGDTTKEEEEGMTEDERGTKNNVENKPRLAPLAGGTAAPYYLVRPSLGLKGGQTTKKNRLREEWGRRGNEAGEKCANWYFEPAEEGPSRVPLSEQR